MKLLIAYAIGQSPGAVMALLFLPKMIEAYYDFFGKKGTRWLPIWLWIFGAFTVSIPVFVLAIITSGIAHVVTELYEDGGWKDLIEEQRARKQASAAIPGQDQTAQVTCADPEKS